VAIALMPLSEVPAARREWTLSAYSRLSPFSIDHKALFEQDHVERPKASAAGLGVSMAAVKRLGRGLADGCVEVHSPVSELAGARLQPFEDQAAIAPSLKLRVDTHTRDLRAPVLGATQGTNSHDLLAREPDQKLAAIVEVDALDRMQIVVPRPVAGVGADLFEREVVQRPNGIVVGVSVAADMERVDSSTIRCVG
jgi:hypothetical protein